MVVINEHPTPRLPMQQTTRDTTRNTMGMKDTTVSNLRDSGVDTEAKQPSLKMEAESIDKSAMQSFTSSMPNNNRQQTPKALLYYPEECHVPSITECKNWNARLMRHMIGQKMAKNQTY